MDKHAMIRREFARTGHLEYFQQLKKHNGPGKPDFYRAVETVLYNPGLVLSTDREAFRMMVWGLGAARGELSVTSENTRKAQQILHFLYKNGGRSILNVPDAQWGIVFLAREYKNWVRPLETWKCSGRNPRRLLASLCKHLLAQYPVPAVLENVFCPDIYHSDKDTPAQWYLWIARGGNLRKAHDLPFEVNKKAAHFLFHAPRNLNPYDAIRWAKIRAMGGSKKLARFLAKDDRYSDWEDPELDDEVRWKLVQFLVNENCEDLGFVGKCYDFAVWCTTGKVRMANGARHFLDRPDEGKFELKGATMASLQRRMEVFDKIREQLKNGDPESWESVGLGTAVWENEHGEWYMKELHTKSDLIQEGRRMKHCVATYAKACALNNSAIFTLCFRDKGSKRPRVSMATLEIDKTTGAALEFLGKCNCEPGEKTRAAMEFWREHYLIPHLEAAKK